MNTPSPIAPLSSLSQPVKGKSNVVIAVVSIVALHVVFAGGLLLQGCKPRATETGLGPTTNPNSNLANELGALTNPSPYGVESTGATANLPRPATNMPAGIDSTGTVSIPQPGLQPDAGVPAAAGATEYLVKKGDIPATIAKAHGVPLNALMKANPGLEPRRLKIGQKIQIPPAATPPTGSAMTVPGGEAAPAGGLTHVVKSGENLTRIAKRYGVTVAELRAANHLKTDRIITGQKLTVPASKLRTASIEGTPMTLPSAPSAPMTASNGPAMR